MYFSIPPTRYWNQSAPLRSHERLFESSKLLKNNPQNDSTSSLPPPPTLSLQQLRKDGYYPCVLHTQEELDNTR